MTTATIRKRTKDESGTSDGCNTPRWLTRKLGRFATDPCSNERSTVQADWSYGLHKHLDGLKLPWRDRTFENWPFSDPEPWAIKSIHELTIGNCTELVTLCKLDPSTQWWAIITQPVVFNGCARFPDVWVFDRRVEYDEPPELVEMRDKKRREAILRVEQALCPRDECVGKGMGRPGQQCATRTGSPHLERIQAAGMKSIPAATTSNNFCSAIIHHRGDAPVLNLDYRVSDDDVLATRWIRPLEAARFAEAQVTRLEKQLAFAYHQIHGPDATIEGCPCCFW